jgi:RNA polymerase sigma-70 factor (ECF subfamily)
MESLRPLLTTYAYNIVGSLEEAKDIVQEAFLKFTLIDSDRIANKKAYLTRTVINLSINQKKRQKKLVAGYPGEWLPEPVATESADTIVLSKEVLSYSLMVLLEKLDAKQRAVFILKEAFDYDHSEIAAVLDITEDNSRKILSRARTQLKTEAPAEEKCIPPDYLDKYLHVIRNGDTAQLEKLLTADITVVSDGGGKVAAFRKPVAGRKSVVALLQGIQIKFYNKLKIEPRLVNHQPALFYYDGGKLVNCQVFSFTNGYVDHIFFIRNPDKLKSLENKF